MSFIGKSLTNLGFTYGKFGGENWTNGEKGADDDVDHNTPWVCYEVNGFLGNTKVFSKVLKKDGNWGDT